MEVELLYSAALLHQDYVEKQERKATSNHKQLVCAVWGSGPLVDNIQESAN